MVRSLIPLLCCALLSACTSVGVVENAARSSGDGTANATTYSIVDYHRQQRRQAEQVSLVLAFSGGGSRAAALSYGVLQALRDTRLENDGIGYRLLDEVDLISAVSGGSFTAAYYGLNSDRLFEDFRPLFLDRDVETNLVHGLASVSHLFSSNGRTEVAIAHYNELLFKGATFADLLQSDGPLIVINATDLGKGVRFSFLQEYFDLLCSDLGSFPIARAVAASSAVPLLFNPVVLQNHDDCGAVSNPWLAPSAPRHADDFEISLVTRKLQSYRDKQQRRYIHLVDGGITDNLGLRAIYEIVEVAGGARSFQQRFNEKAPSRMVFIVVDASTDVEPRMDLSAEEPPLEETINALTDAQMHRYNAATLELLKSAQRRWSEAISTADHTVEPYFIELGFNAVDDPAERLFFNRIPTTLSLDAEQVERLIAAGGNLLRNNPEFRRLLADLASNSATGETEATRDR
jgi:NTE family protein